MFKEGHKAMSNIYSNLEKEVRELFSGNEEGKEMRLKVIKLPRAQAQQFKTAVFAYLAKEPTTSEAIYCILNNLTSRPFKVCPTCNNNYPPSKFYSMKEGYKFHDHCSKSCRGKNPQVQAKLAATNLEKYGHTNNMWANREKTKLKWVDKFGVDNPMKSKTIQEKVKATNLEKISVEWPGQNDACRQKMIQTSIERYGNDQKFNKQQAKETSLQRYGVEYPMQHPPIFEKAQRYKRKTGIWPSGKEYSYQGYENVGINALINSGITEDQIIISEPTKIPTIEYFNPVKGKQSHYFPDIYIPTQNRLIEIKSTWTMRDQFAENLAKHKAAKALGINHEIWICTAKKVIEIIL